MSPTRPDPAGFALAELAPAAQSILAAARLVLERDGYAGLTLSRIAAEAGATKSLIAYHFGGKDGLLAALVDSLWHDEDLDLVRRLDHLPDAPAARLRTLIDVHHELALMTPEFRMYFDLLPSLMRDTRARRSHAELNRTYRSLGVKALAGTILGADEQLAMASLLLAVNEGAGALLILDPGGFDHEGAFALLQSLAAARARVQAGAHAARTPARDDGAEGTRSGSDVTSEQPDIRVTLADPAAGLPPVARRLLDGAVRVLTRDGLSRLTFEAVADASGEPRSATTYYFGDKHGLVIAVHDTLLFRAQRLAALRLRAAAAAEGGDPLAGMPAHAQDGLRTFRTLYELFPAIMNDDALRALQADHLAWLRAAMAAAADACGAAWDRALVDLALALTYGLPIQLLLDRRGLDPQPVLAMWRSLVAVRAQASPD